jgi:acid phosphatase class B
MNKVFKISAICLLSVLTLTANGQVSLKDKLKKTVNSAAQSVDKIIKKDNTKQGETGQQP